MLTATLAVDAILDGKVGKTAFWDVDIVDGCHKAA